MKRTLLMGLTAALALVTAAKPSAATELIVDGVGGQPGKFPTISAAVAAVHWTDRDADVIRITHSPIYETNSIIIRAESGHALDSLEVIGETNTLVIFDGAVGEYALDVHCPAVKQVGFKNLTLIPKDGGETFSHGGVRLRVESNNASFENVVVTASLPGDLPADPGRRLTPSEPHTSWNGGAGTDSFSLEAAVTGSIHMVECQSAFAGQMGFFFTGGKEAVVELDHCAARYGDADGLHARRCEGRLVLKQCDSTWNTGAGFIFVSGQGPLALSECRFAGNSGRGLQIGEDAVSTIPRTIDISGGSFSDNGWTDYNLSTARKFEYGILLWGGSASTLEVHGTASSPVLFVNNFRRGLRIDNARAAVRRIEYAVFAGRHYESGLQFLQLDLTTTPLISHCAFFGNALQSQDHSQFSISATAQKPSAIEIRDCTFFNAVGNGYHHISLESFNEHPPENVTLRLKGVIFAGGPPFKGGDERALDLDGNNCSAEIENCAFATSGPYALNPSYLEANLSGHDNHILERDSVHADPNFVPSRCATLEPADYAADGTFLRAQSAAYAAAKISGYNSQVDPDGPPLKPLRVAVYTDQGPGKVDVFQTVRVLQSCTDMTCEEVKARDIWEGALDHCDVVMFPGGGLAAESYSLKEKGRNMVLSFVEKGGGCIGTCAGAYLLMHGPHYPHLEMLDAQCLDYDHWERGHGIVRLKLTPMGQQILGSSAVDSEVEYWQGPLIAPLGSQLDYSPLATYASEIHNEQTTSSAMPGSTAIAAGNFGAGKYMAISCHPEGVITPIFHSDYLYRAILWVAGRSGPALEQTHSAR